MKVIANKYDFLMCMYKANKQNFNYIGTVQTVDTRQL